MVELHILEEWIPEQMAPGTVFLLENPGSQGELRNPYWAVLSCVRCGICGLITKNQCSGLDAVICGSSICSAEFWLDEEGIRFRQPN